MSHAYGVEGNITVRGINVNIARLLETGGTLPHGQQKYHLSPLSSTRVLQSFSMFCLFH